MPYKRLLKSDNYPRPHNDQLLVGHGLEAANTTIYPISFYDEGKGAASSYNANPEHASFAETEEPNCYPESKLDTMKIQVELNLTKAFLDTDGLKQIRVGVMGIATNFLEDLTAKDELSGLEVEDVLELQHETTDRQTYPLWSGTDMKVVNTGQNTLPAAVPGLTTDQQIETVAFSVENYYDMIQYGTIAGKLKKCTTGLKWIVLTKDRIHRTIKFSIPYNAKRVNPYQFFGIMVTVPNSGNRNQIHIATESSNVEHVRVRFTSRYQEWNKQFNMERS